MNKEIFLRDLRRFLADIPEDEREQALNYYEDYFEDAGPENEQKVIDELGSPIDIAKQIKSTNQENIAYGQGNNFYQNTDYPNVYGNNDYTQKNAQDFKTSNNGSTYQYQNPKKSWTQDSTKVAIVIVLAILAIPVGIPIVSSVFGILVAICAVLFSLIGICFGVGTGLTVSGIVALVGSIFAISTGNIASSLVVAGTGFVSLSVGLFLFWFGTVFCSKFFPAVFSGIGKCFVSIKNKVINFFN